MTEFIFILLIAGWYYHGRSPPLPFPDLLQKYKIRNNIDSFFTGAKIRECSVVDKVGNKVFRLVRIYKPAERSSPHETKCNGK
jgi:hypothetical protein